ncbi:transposable element Tcb2 transposase [Trichonephila clavipes]|nr:transposable element Tcb2 transposase [Trichonephila clavipes]
MKSCPLFKDESRFSAKNDSQSQLTWREVGTRFHPNNITERDRYGGAGVNVCGGIMLNGRTELRIFNRGFVIRDRYCKVIFPNVSLFRGVIGPDFVFMDDNARPHRTVDVLQLMEGLETSLNTITSTGEFPTTETDAV